LPEMTELYTGTRKAYDAETLGRIILDLLRS
jgi:hypothetical protein